MWAPWPVGERCKVMDECLTSLQRHSPAKYEVAMRLHPPTEASGKGRPSSPSEPYTPLLATCFGNRSAALYELGRTEVMWCLGAQYCSIS